MMLLKLDFGITVLLQNMKEERLLTTLDGTVTDLNKFFVEEA